jgi:hypothetical protein
MSTVAFVGVSARPLVACSACGSQLGSSPATRMRSSGRRSAWSSSPAASRAEGKSGPAKWRMSAAAFAGSASAQARSAAWSGSSAISWTARSQCRKAARLVVAACSAGVGPGCGSGLRVQPCAGLGQVAGGRGLIMRSGHVYMPPTQGGAIAQLGERLNGIQEVVGSIPIGSTKAAVAAQGAGADAA